MAEIQDKEVLEFLDVFKKGTRKVYAAGLSSFLSFYRTTGEGENVSDFLDALEADVRLPRRQRKRVGEKVIRDFIRELEKQKLAPKTIRTYVSVVQSLVSYYGMKLSTRYVSLPSCQPASKKHPWTLQEVGEFILDMRDVELRSISATMFQSGLSLADVLGIAWGDIKREYRRGVVPLCFDFSRKKTDVPFMTFIGSLGFSYLKEHLEGKGRKKDADPIYGMSKRVVELRFQKLAKKKLGNYEGSNPCRPHSLRSAFNTLLKDAGCPESYVEFWMGHRVPEVRRVYISKSREGWRAEYKKYESYLTFNA